MSRTFVGPTITNDDEFGTAVAIDGNRVLIGAVGDETQGRDVGQAHLFDATTGALVRTFDDPTVTAEDRFSFSAAIDGNRVLIGARTHGPLSYEVGQAHLFVVPEPNSLALLSLGGMTLVSAGRRHKRRS